MERWEGKVAVVTGASSGIGESIAKKLVESGLKVAALARRSDRLKELEQSLTKAKGTLKTFKCDITDLSEVDSVFNEIENLWGNIHVLVNNAGYLKVSPLLDPDMTGVKQMFEVNVVGLTACSKCGVKSMLKHQEYSHIININSVAGHVVLLYPGVGHYNATKYSVTVLSESLRNELAMVTNKIKSISPGLVDTEMVAQFKDKFDKDRPCLKSEDVADAVIYTLGTPTSVNVTELTIKGTAESFLRTIGAAMEAMKE